jgi:hypothetical protein
MNDFTAFTIATILCAAFGGPLWATLLLGAFDIFILITGLLDRESGTL